jgi:GAF domain-containing protein
MDETTRESQIGEAFVAVADTLTKDFDVVDLLHTLVEQCNRILHTDAGGLMLVDGVGRLQLMTSSSEAAEFVEVMQLNAESGPCIDCFTTESAISVPDITAASLWPAFRSAALQQGFLSVHATPLKLRGTVIGTLNLFRAREGALDERDAALAQALSDVATIGILQERLIKEGTLLAEQLHRALDSRILIEQAKGMIAHSLSVTMEEAFDIIRSHARNHNVTIRAVALGISGRTLSIRNVALAAGPASSR